MTGGTEDHCMRLELLARRGYKSFRSSRRAYMIGSGTITIRLIAVAFRPETGKTLVNFA